MGYGELLSRKLVDAMLLPNESMNAGNITYEVFVGMHGMFYAAVKPFETNKIASPYSQLLVVL